MIDAGIFKLAGIIAIIGVVAGFIGFIYKKGKETGKRKEEEETREQTEVRLIELTKELNNLVDDPNSPFGVSKPQGKWSEIRKTNT
mgnify:CR=1 FL=1